MHSPWHTRYMGPFLFGVILGLPAARAYFPVIPAVVAYFPVLVLVAMMIVKMGIWPLHRLRLEVGVQVVLVCVLLSWLALSSSWTLSYSQYEVDLRYLLFAGIITVTAGATLSFGDLDRLIKVICTIGLIVGLGVVAEFAVLGSLQTSGTKISEIYLTIANLVGVAATGASIRFVASPGAARGWGFLALALMLELSLSLARGALLSSILILVVGVVTIPLLKIICSRGLRVWSFGVFKMSAVVILIVGALGMGMQVERTRVRLVRMFSGHELAEGGRGEIWRVSLDNIREAPIAGYGLGSNGLLSRGFDGGYPHNLFMQVWLDGGWLAVILLVAILGLPIFVAVQRVVQGERNTGTDILFSLLAMFVFEILEFSKSGNFYAARILLVLSVAVVIAATAPMRSSSQ